MSSGERGDEQTDGPEARTGVSESVGSRMLAFELAYFASSVACSLGCSSDLTGLFAISGLGEELQDGFLKVF